MRKAESTLATSSRGTGQGPRIVVIARLLEARAKPSGRGQGPRLGKKLKDIASPSLPTKQISKSSLKC